jgi:fermentation-respiration switch protein FrsA (DUF1100 family)
MTYFPMHLASSNPEAWLPGARAVTLTTRDGLELGGWFLTAEGAPRATVVVFNGNGGNRSMRTPLAAALAREGFSTLLFDYRGYGENAGSPSETGLIADAHAARDWLESQPGVDSTRIVYFGESLGTGVAVALAAERPPAAAVLRSPFTSLADVGSVHYPFLPVGVLLRDRFASIDRIAGASYPLLIVVGERDRIVPTRLSQRLYEAAPQTAKRYVEIAGAGHNDLALLDGEEFIETVSTFIATALSEGP